MSDHRLRELQRRAEHGGFNDKVRYISELVRTGSMDLSDYYSLEAVEGLYMAEPFQTSYGRTTYRRTREPHELDHMAVPMLWVLLHSEGPDKPSFLDSHIITALDRLKQEDILVQFLVQQIPLRDTDSRDAMRQIINVIRGIPTPMHESTRRFLVDLLNIPLLQDAVMGRMIEDRNPLNIGPLFELMQTLDPTKNNYRVINAIGRSVIGGQGAALQDTVVGILIDFMRDTGQNSHARTAAAARLAEILEVEAIPYIEAVMETMSAVYDENDNFAHWNDYHSHEDLKKLIRHINRRFVELQEHCSGYCRYCKEEDRRVIGYCSRPFEQCTICSETRQLWHS